MHRKIECKVSRYTEISVDVTTLFKVRNLSEITQKREIIYKYDVS